MPRQPTEATPPRQEPAGCLAAIARVFWLLVGNAILFFLAVYIGETGTMSALDIAFWAVVAALGVVRYVDITRLNGLTTDGEPASLRHWRRYVVALVLGSAALWGSAHTALRWAMAP